MTAQKVFTNEQASNIADKLNIDFSKVKFNLEQFRHGMDIELEHGNENTLTNVTDNDPITTGKISLAHLNEYPDYYDRLDKLEIEAEKFWKNKSKFN